MHRANSVCPRVVILFVVVVCSGTIYCQNTSDAQIDSKSIRFDVTPLVGYRTGMSFPTGIDVQQTTSPHVDLDAAPSYGIAAGARVDDENVIEFRWARQGSHIHLEGSSLPSDLKVVVDQFHGDFTHEYVLHDWPAWARPFVMGSVGATRISSRSGNSFTRFSFGLGGGVKVFFTRHLGVRAQAEWLPVVVDPEVVSFICGGGCIAHLSASLVSQGEVAVGPVLRF